MSSEMPVIHCQLLRLPDELRFKIYEELFGAFEDQTTIFIDLVGDERTTSSSHVGYHPPYIRQACKQLYNETSSLFFRASTLSVYFTEVKLLQDFLEEIGQCNRRMLRHLELNYATLEEGGGEREDIDVEIWSAVATALKKCFRDDTILLETLELETADDRNGWVRFGGSPREDPRAVAISSTVQAMKLVQVFPCLKLLRLEEVILLSLEDDDKELELDNLPIINFFRKS